MTSKKQSRSPLVQNSSSMSRPKLLIIGSGFHKHILHGSRSPLSCWNFLLREVAEKHRLGHVLSQSSEPTLQWESLVTAAVQKYKNQRRKASTFEEKLRKDVAAILRGEAIKHEQACSNNCIGEMLRNFHGHIVNLNFDHMFDRLLGIPSKDDAHPQIKKLPKMAFCHRKNLPGLFRRWTSKRHPEGSVTVWHPHGTVQNAKTLRLGYRDYGLQPAIFASAFDSFRGWQGKFLKKHAASSPPSETDYQRVLAHVVGMDAQQKATSSSRIQKHDHWITRFMLYDVFVIGAGISPSEIGLRWLLVQRQRNLARLSQRQRPKTICFLVENSLPTSLADFDVSSSWDQAWRKALTC